jgi:hypothetical protein
MAVVCRNGSQTFSKVFKILLRHRGEVVFFYLIKWHVPTMKFALRLRLLIAS